MKNLSIALVGFALSSLLCFSFAEQEEAGFVRVHNGHLYLGDKRLRLWGMNIQGPNAPGHSDYAKVDANIRRLKALGFNAVRLWGGYAFCEVKEGKRVYHRYVKGDGSPLDLMDYCIARLKENGFIIWLTWFDYASVTPEDVDLVKEPETRQAWLEAVKQLQKPEYARGRPLIFYFDRRAKEVYKDHISKVLNHFNQYTGLAVKEDPVFGIYELANELQFMDNMLGIKGKTRWGHASVEEILPPFFVQELRQAWNEFLRKRYGSDKALLKAWGKLDEGESLARGTVKLQPTYETASKYPEQRGSDIVDFYRHLFVETCGEFVGHIRKQGKPGRGCAVVPIIFHTIASVHGLHIGYSNSFGDAVAYGNYWWQHTDEGRLKKKPPLRYPWHSFVETGWSWGFLHPYKQLDKPLLLYEINCFRTDKFRAEFPLLHAICGSWSDLDGIFFYIWDYGFSRGEPTLWDDRLYYPTLDHSWHGVTTYSDEIFLSQAFVSGLLFRLGLLKPPDKPTIVRYGRNDLQNIRQQWYGVLHRVFPTMLLHGLQITFDPNLPETKVEGQMVDEKEWGEQDWRIGDVLHWSRQEGFLKLDLPAAKAAAGFLPPSLDFRDGVRLEGVRKLWLDPDDFAPSKDGQGKSYRPYYVFTMVSENGENLAQARRIFVSLVSTSHNAGFTIDPERLGPGGGDGIAPAILSHGTKPVLVNRVGAILVVPFAKGWHYRKLDFSLRPFEEGTAQGKVIIAPTDPLFLLVIERP